MPRGWYINGPSMVIVRGGDHLSLINPDNPNLTMSRRQELGLSQDPIHIAPTFHHKDIYSDAFGPSVPAEVMWNLADVTITMNLIHFDRSALARCIQEAGAGGTQFNPPGGEMFSLAPASALLGNGLPIFASGNHFIELSISSPVGRTPWVFPTTYLFERPIIIPLGVEASAVRLFWKAIPYRQLFNPAAPPTSGIPARDSRSADTTLWHHLFND